LKSFGEGLAGGFGDALPRRVGELSHKPVGFWILDVQSHESTIAYRKVDSEEESLGSGADVGGEMLTGEG
jgi:hypothetical protein